MKQYIIYGQTFYFLITGIWPLLSISTFMAITGPKFDIWLVKMVGLLAFSVGAGLLYLSITKRRESGLLLVVFLSCLSFFAIDVYYVSIKRILPVYLGDAVMQIVFAVNLLLYWKENRMKENG